MIKRNKLKNGVKIILEKIMESRILLRKLSRLTIAGDYRYSNNYLLLIDEIDLYLHPEWQQEFISVLLNELEKQFPDKKIQLVFSTHSPLLLY